MGAVSKALKHGEQTRGHEMLGLCKRGQRLWSCGHSLSGREGSSLSRRLGVLFAALPGVFSQTLRSRRAFAQPWGCTHHGKGGPSD
jgi:hypothetical protein